MVLLAYLSCNKHDDVPTFLIVARWKHESFTIQTFINNGNLQASGNQNYNAADYAEFKADEMAEAHALANTKTFSYSLVNDTLLIINGR